MAITQLPTPPSRADSVNFATRADAFMAALPQFQAEANALQITTNAQTAANEAASQAAAVAAGVARDAAVAAWGASTAPAEQLATISQSLHVGAIVKAIIYDTAKDSDGGAWRKRCNDKSWYTEALGGDRWLGRQASIAAAWTAAGATTGAIFQASATAGPLTIGKYYAATSNTTATEVFRGISREFPALVGIVAESTRVVIYDLTQATCPMWMVFLTTSTTANGLYGIGNIYSLAAANGLLAVCGASRLCAVHFIRDNSRMYHSSGGSFINPASLSSRNVIYVSGAIVTSDAIANSTVNDVAITVLDTAPTDPATGLPVPTIAVATAGGVSVIKDDGTVVNITGTDTLNATYGIALVGDELSFSLPAATHGSYGSNKIPATSFSATSIFSFFRKRYYYAVSVAAPSLLGGPFSIGYLSGKGKTPALGSSLGVSLLLENPATPAKGMVNYITNAFNSGWMVGDIRGAYLADTSAETITASGELVTAGDFSSSAGWTLPTGWAIAAGKLTYNGTGTAFSNAAYSVATVAGRMYTAQITVDSISASAVVVNCYGAVTTQGGVSAAGVINVTFLATAATTALAVQNQTAGQTIQLDNFSVKMADPDRSVKNTGMVINGSLTKTAVAAAAGLVAYSGFSTATNYLTQPYNANLDFGTSDFCVMGWVKSTSSAASQYLVARSSGGAGVRFQVLLNITTGFATFYTNDGTTANSCSNATSLSDSNWHHIAVVKIGGVKSIYIDGVFAATTTPATNNTLTNATATLAIGCETDLSGAATASSMTLWRIGATAPSADQIAHIYRTELPLFQAGAQCTIAGTSAAVTALAYDDVADELQVGTSWGRSEFKDLVRVASEATTVGAITSVAAYEGVVLTGGASSAKVYAPAMYLRDELRRKDVARKALGRIPAFFDYTATASQTAFVAPKGFTIKAVYHNGTLKREATTGVYWTRSSDGFAETATLSVGATVSDWISIMCVRV